MANRLSIVIALMLPAGLVAQNAPTSNIRIYTEPDGARFYVDGAMYIASQTFSWPQGSKHLVQFPLAEGNVQFSLDGNTRYGFGGWTDNNGYLSPANSAFQTITASPSVTSLKATLTVSYRVMLRFSSSPFGVGSCGAPGGAIQDYLRTGIIFFDGQCFGADADIFVDAGAHTLNAFPYPGAVFTGWSVNGSVSDPYLHSIDIKGPVTVYGAFRPAKRVRFTTEPAGFKVLVDGTATPTTSERIVDRSPTSARTCPFNLSLSQTAPITIQELCYGDFDFVPGSTHVLSAPSPQLDSMGRLWVFSGFSNGLGDKSSYTADSNVATADVIVAKFVPGVRASVRTNPPGLKLQVDGREDWPAYDFVWGAGTTHTLAAPETQTDASGRRWTFHQWTDGGSATREVIVDAGNPNMQLVADYTSPGRLRVLTNPPGVKLQVDGAECTSPCVLDRPPGTEVSIAAADIANLDGATRVEFLGWSDGQPATHTVTMNGDVLTVSANYACWRRVATVSDPEGGVDFVLDPPSPDQFYRDGTELTVTAKPRPGFKFRRWAGDLAGIYNIGRLTMSAPRAVVAILDRTPYIAPAGVRNAAGDTPEAAVAPGSIISIYGESLAPRLEISQRVPLDQTLADVVVTVSDRILPLLYVSPQQINAQLPSDLPDGEYTLRVQWAGKAEVTSDFAIARNAPGLFSNPVDDKLYALALHEDGSLVTLDSPARRGEAISIYGTGFGPYNNRIVDGFAFPNPSEFALLDPVQVTAGERMITPVWAGGAPGYVGVALTRIAISDDLPSAATVDLRVTINGKASNTVLLPVE